MPLLLPRAILVYFRIRNPLFFSLSSAAEWLREKYLFGNPETRAPRTNERVNEWKHWLKLNDISRTPGKFGKITNYPFSTDSHENIQCKERICERAHIVHVSAVKLSRNRIFSPLLNKGAIGTPGPNIFMPFCVLETNNFKGQNLWKLISPNVDLTKASV